MNEVVKASKNAVSKSPTIEVSQQRMLILTGLLFLALFAASGLFSTRSDDLGRIAIRDLPVRVGIDPNSASWYELAQLPGVGEALARRIIAYRESGGEAVQRSRKHIFESAHDLLPISGIGPRILARISPHLVFPQSPRILVDSAPRNR